MKNTKIKQRKCPFGKVELCSEYGNCADCTWHKVIEKYEKKLAKQNQEWKLIFAQRFIEKEQIETQSLEASQMLEKLESKQNDVSRQTAKNIFGMLKFLYGEMAREYTNWDGNQVQAVSINQLFAGMQEVAREYGVEVNK